MKKRLLSLLLAVCGVFAFTACGGGDDSSADPNQPYGSYELTDFVGDDTYTIVGAKYTLTTSGETPTELGESGANTVVQGEENGYTLLTVKGMESSAICPAAGGTLTFRNLTIVGGKSQSTAELPTYRAGYFGVGGNIRFENCVIDGSVQIRENADVTFEGCTFRSPAQNKYSVWMSDGSVKFENCDFDGYRGLKLHEQPQYGYDIETVRLSDCRFNELSAKPGIAIGDIVVSDPADTALIVQDCLFLGCAAWDTEGSREGVDGFYESDVSVDSFAFTVSDVEVDGEIWNSPRGVEPQMPE